MKKDKKKIILLIVIAIVLLLAMLVIMFKINEKVSLQNFEEKINEINDINKIFESIDITSETNYKNDDYVCYKYNGENEREYVDRIKKIYTNPFYEYGNFNLVTAEIDENVYEEHLYLCLEKNCKVTSVEDYEFGYDENGDDIVIIGDYGYYIEKVNGEWEFIYSVVPCESN